MKTIFTRKTLVVDEKTHERIMAICRKDQSIDTVINMLLDKHEGKNKK